MFVAIEGPNGVGKTSVTERLAVHLRARGIATTVLRQPSQGPLGRMAREREHELIGWPLATLVVADRYLQVRDDIEPALAAGRTVIVDRYVASTLVLQRLDGLDPGVLWEINAQARRPDLMVVLQADPDTLRDRLRHRARYSRFEQMPDGAEQEMQFYTEAITLLERHGYCTLRIDTTSMPADGVARLIMERLESHRHSPRVATDE